MGARSRAPALDGEGNASGSLSSAAFHRNIGGFLLRSKWDSAVVVSFCRHVRDLQARKWQAPPAFSNVALHGGPGEKAVSAGRARHDVNILTQIGFVGLVALAAKNAILIVEFARDIEREGRLRLDAVIVAQPLNTIGLFGRYGQKQGYKISLPAQNRNVGETKK